MEENLSGKEKNSKLGFLKKKEIWISGIIGILIGAALIYLLGLAGVSGLGNDIIATSKAGDITKNDLYNEMKKYYPVTYALEIVDRAILDKKYELTEEQNKEIEEQAEMVFSQYELYYGYTEEDFLKENGFESKEDFIHYMELDYKRNLFCLEYFKTIISDDEIKKYYNENDVYGEINTKHILVQISDEVTAEQALAKANEILAELKGGKNFDEVATQYADGDKIISENVDIDWLNGMDFSEEYVSASKSLEKDNFTAEAVLTNFGYHIIYCINKADKPTLEESTDDIVEKLAENLEAEDQYIRYKALIKLREENGVKFKYSKFKEEYKEYCDEINAVNELEDEYLSDDYIELEEETVSDIELEEIDE